MADVARTIGTKNNVFCYIGHAMLRQKINQNGAKSHSKTALKSTPQLASISEPTWLHFGRVLGAKLGPNWHKIASKLDPKNDQKMNIFWIALGSGFSRFWAPRWPPIGGQNFHFSAPFSLLGASWGQDGPKTPPRAPRTPPRPPQEAPNHRFLEDLGANLGGIWHPTARQPSNPSTQQPSTQQPSNHQPSNQQPDEQTTNQPNNPQPNSPEPPVCRMSHRSPKAWGGGDSPQAFSIYIYIYIYSIPLLSSLKMCTHKPK